MGVTITQEVIEWCNNCDARFWSFDPFVPIWCMKCELLDVGHTWSCEVVVNN